jgi:lipoprotein-anchoring transpeptidase ErfK/SrfK
MLCVGAAAKRRFCCAAIVTASIAAGVASPASAASFFYWNDSEPAIIRPVLPLQHPQKPRHKLDKTAKAAAKEAAKPQGPLIVAVSTNKQQLKAYDANGLFATAPVSTGMKNHPTPFGVFSVIQKQKFHRSNIYSNAPMPFMERITWSGIALHAGVLPGYPASHGCIRMPPGFAVRMYGLTRMGTRVLVTPGEVSPSSFTHPLLAAFKPPEPTASAQPESNPPAVANIETGAAPPAPITIEAHLELRTTVGHTDVGQASTESPATARREQTHTADASSPISGPISDARQANQAARVETASNAHESDAVSNPDMPAPAPVTAPPADASAKPVDGVVKANSVKADDTKPTDSAETPAPSDSNPAAGKPADTTPADKPAAAAKPELKHNSPIAMFVSRKDGKLYIRQNFAPVLSVPVIIAPSDRPLGTHVFTAAADGTDANVIHWSVISLPTRSAVRSEDGEKIFRHGNKAADAEAKVAPAPDSASEALDRITIPADVMAWIGQALSSGSSLIVSDQGIHQGETGEGTDFILLLR